MPRLPVLVLLLALVGCGEPEDLDRTDPEAVAEAIVSALAASDFEAMQRLCSPRCWRDIQHDLTRFQVDLAQPDTRSGQVVHRMGRDSLGAEWPEAVAEARAGSFKAAWRLFVRIRPFLLPVQLGPAKAQPGKPDEVAYLYVREGTTKHRIKLVRRQGVWVVQFVAY